MARGTTSRDRVIISSDLYQLAELNAILNPRVFVKLRFQRKACS